MLLFSSIYFIHHVKVWSLNEVIKDSFTSIVLQRNCLLNISETDECFVSYQTQMFVALVEYFLTTCFSFMQLYRECLIIAWTMKMPHSPRRQKVTRTCLPSVRMEKKICDTDGDAKSIAGALCAEAEQRHSLLWEYGFVLCCAEMSASSPHNQYRKTMSRINPDNLPLWDLDAAHLRDN